MAKIRTAEIERRLKGKGWKVLELCRRTGISPTAMYRILGERQDPHFRTVKKIADAFGTTPEVLTRDEPPQEAEKPTGDLAVLTVIRRHAERAVRSHLRLAKKKSPQSASDRLPVVEDD